MTSIVSSRQALKNTVKR